jgi:hypothetical protein
MDEEAYTAGPADTQLVLQMMNYPLLQHNDRRQPTINRILEITYLFASADSAVVDQIRGTKVSELRYLVLSSFQTLFDVCFHESEHTR